MFFWAVGSRLRWSPFLSAWRLSEGTAQPWRDRAPSALSWMALYPVAHAVPPIARWPLQAQSEQSPWAVPPVYYTVNGMHRQWFMFFTVPPSSISVTPVCNHSSNRGLYLCWSPVLSRLSLRLHPAYSRPKDSSVQQHTSFSHKTQIFLKFKPEIHYLLACAWQESLADLGLFLVGVLFKGVDKPLKGNSAAAEFIAIREF